MRTSIMPRVVTRNHKVILIAGGAGFVGSNLCRRLIDEGHEIICVDNFQTGNRCNIAPFLQHRHFRLIQHDICDPLDISGPVDEIYNMACAASPDRYQEGPVHTCKTCFLGALNLLELARRKKARILQSSTSEVYGDPEISLQDESYRGCVNTCGPRACYDEGKRVAETLFWEYGAHNGVETRIARIFNTYGPNMDPADGRVVSNFIVQALKGEDLTVYGTGLQTRSFCYVSDLVDGLIRLMASDEKMPVNLGNPGEFTMLELAEKVVKMVRSRAGVTFRPLPQDDPRQRKPNIPRAKTILGWSPKVNLDEGLAATIEWYRERLAADQEAEAPAGQ